ncbi:MAG: winged helix-turn-helix domain-containing protein [Planctomycetota bacterium]
MVESVSCTAEIGELAGVIWHALDDDGPKTLTKLAKDIDAPRDRVMQAVGWLAREGKVDLKESKRRRTISLR